MLNKKENTKILIMKSSLFLGSIFIFQLAFSFTARSQEIKLADLVKVECKDSACFATFITKKGFTYVQSSGGTKINFMRYKSTSKYLSTSDPKFEAPDMIAFGVRDGKAIDITFATVKWENYLSISNELKELGYKYLKVDKLEDNVDWVYYKSPTYPRIMMFTTFPETKGDQPCIIYQVRFMRLP